MPEVAISIVVPIFNRENYLADCLASIERQTLPNIEVLCVDDGSTDNSAAIVQQFAQTDSRFKLLQFQENKGAAVARNYAIEKASGEFLAFMDSDDWYPEDSTLEKLYYAAVNHGVSVAGGSLSVYYVQSGELVTDFSYDDYLDKYYWFKTPGLIDYRDWQGDYGYTRFIFKKELITNNNISFPPIKRQEDPIFFVQAMLAAQTFYAIPDVVYCCRTGYKSEEMDIETAKAGLDAVCQLIDVSIAKDLPLLRQHQYSVIQWYAFDAPIIEERSSESFLARKIKSFTSRSKKLLLRNS